MALQLSHEGFLADLGLDALFGVHLLQPAVLILELLEPGHQRSIHAAELRATLVARRAGDAVLPAQLGDRNARLGLLEDRQDLVVRKS